MLHEEVEETAFDLFKLWETRDYVIGYKVGAAAERGEGEGVLSVGCCHCGWGLCEGIVGRSGLGN